MCINKETTPESDIQAIRDLIPSLQSDELKVLLTGIAGLYEQGETMCGVGVRRDEPNEPAVGFAPQQQSLAELPAGIYPPSTGNYL